MRKIIDFKIDAWKVECIQKTFENLNSFETMLTMQHQFLKQNLRPGSIRAWDEMQQQFLKNFFPSHRTNSFKSKSPLSLKNQEKHFTNVGIGIETCLILALIMVLKHGDWFHIFMKG